MKKLLAALMILSALTSFAFSQDLPAFYGKEVLVSATRFPILKTESPFSFDTITEAELKALGSKSLPDALKIFAGIDITTTGFLGSQTSVKLRNSTAQQTLILVDGKKMNSPLLGGFDAGDILLDNVERIEIIKAPCSSIYGADAVGGVINVITRKSAEKTRSGYSIAYGDFGTQRYSLALSSPQNGPLPENNFTAGKTYSAGFRDNSAYSAYNISSNFLWNLPWNADISWGFAGYLADKGVPGSLSFPSPTTTQKDTNVSTDITGNYRPLEDQLLTLKMFGNYYDQLYHYPNWLDPTVFIDEHYYSNTSGINFQHLFEVPSQKISWGGEYTAYYADSALFGMKHTKNIAVFAEDEISAAKNFLIIPSVRYDDHLAYGQHTTPRTGFLFKPQKNLALRASWGQSFRAPTFNELFTTGSGNPALEPEKGNSYNIGLETTAGGVLANFNFYSTRVENLIKWQPQDPADPWGAWSPYNVDAAALEGFEIELTKNIGKDLKTFVNYTVSTSKNTTTDKEIPYSPNSKFNAGLINTSSPLTYSLTVRSVGERYTDAANTQKLPAYFTVDANTAWSINNFDISLKLNNLFNEAYQEIADYPMPGRTYLFEIKYNI